MKTLNISMSEERFREIVLAIGVIDDRWLKENWGLGYYPVRYLDSSESTLKFRERLDDIEGSLFREGSGINLSPFFEEEKFGGFSTGDVMLNMVYHRLNKSPDTTIEELRESIDMEANTELMKKVDADWNEIKNVTELMINDLIKEDISP